MPNLRLPISSVLKISRYAADCGPGFSYVGDEHYRGLYNLVNHADRQETKSRMTLMIR